MKKTCVSCFKLQGNTDPKNLAIEQVGMEWLKVGEISLVDASPDMKVSWRTVGQVYDLRPSLGSGVSLLCILLHSSVICFRSVSCAFQFSICVIFLSSSSLVLLLSSSHVLLISVLLSSFFLLFMLSSVALLHLAKPSYIRSSFLSIVHLCTVPLPLLPQPLSTLLLFLLLLLFFSCLSLSLLLLSQGMIPPFSLPASPCHWISSLRRIKT